MDFPQHKLGGPPRICLGPSVTIYLLSCCVTAYHFILIKIPTPYQHFSKKQKCDAPQAVKRQKKSDTKASEIRIKETDTNIFEP